MFSAKRWRYRLAALSFISLLYTGLKAQQQVISRTDSILTFSFASAKDCSVRTESGRNFQRMRYDCSGKTMIRLLTADDRRQIQVTWVFDKRKLIYAGTDWSLGTIQTLKQEKIYLAADTIAAWTDTSGRQLPPDYQERDRLAAELVRYAATLIEK